MRVIAAALVIALLLPAVGAMTSRGAKACCCAGATCSMKRACANDCGMRRAEPAAVPTPAVLTEIAVTTMNVVVRPLVPRDFQFAARDRRTPDSPPPKQA